jgi:hypothetical protein
LDDYIGLGQEIFPWGPGMGLSKKHCKNPSSEKKEEIQNEERTDSDINF